MAPPFWPEWDETMRDMDLEFEEHADAEVEEEPAPTTVYRIDERWYQEHNLSFTDVLRSRMCDDCQQRAAAGETADERHTVIDKKTGRTTFEVQRVPFASQPMRRIREDCSAKKGYIAPDMSVLEAVFRVYLAHGNQPMPLSNVREHLQDWCPDRQCRWLMLSLKQLDRIMQNDQYYGLQPFELPT